MAQRVVAGLALFAALPLLAVLFVAVRLDSRGGFLYRQQRPGRNGRLFEAIKVRTMTVGADKNPMLARAVTSETPEVTRVGRVLRDLKLDELPQLWNVVRGDMAIVGPRPIAISLQEHLAQAIPGFADRLAVRPGLTSLGQVCIQENAAVEQVEEDWAVRFEAERHYLANRSIAYDLVIIWLTFRYCLRKFGRQISLERPMAGALASITQRS